MPPVPWMIIWEMTVCLSKIKVVFSTGSDGVNINVDRIAYNDDSVNGNVSSFDSSVSGLDNDANVIMFTDSVGTHINHRQFLGIYKTATLRRTPGLRMCLMI